MLLILFAFFILLPLAELYVIIQVGGAIGILPTLGLLVADSILGAVLLRSQGRQAWARFNEALAHNRVPAREVFDGAMIILGGALLLTPGFITDIAGLCLLLPPTRVLIRRALGGLAARRTGFRWVVMGASGRGPGARRGPGPEGPGARQGYDVEGTATEVPDEHGELGAGGSGG